MGNPRSFTSKFNARNTELAAFIKSKAGRSAKARREAFALAAMGRPADLPEQARVSVALRRIAGFPTSVATRGKM